MKNQSFQPVVATLVCGFAAAATTVEPTEHQISTMVSLFDFNCTGAMQPPRSFQPEMKGLSPSVVGDMVPVDPDAFRCDPKGQGIAARNIDATIQSEFDISGLLAEDGLAIEFWITPADHTVSYGGKPNMENITSKSPILPIFRIGRDAKAKSKHCDENQLLFSQQGPHIVFAYADGDKRGSCRVHRIRSHVLVPNVPIQVVAVLRPRTMTVYIDGRAAAGPFRNAYREGSFATIWSTKQRLQILPNGISNGYYFDGIVHRMGLYRGLFDNRDAILSNMFGQAHLDDVIVDPIMRVMSSYMPSTEHDMQANFPTSAPVDSEPSASPIEASQVYAAPTASPTQALFHPSASLSSRTTSKVIQSSPSSPVEYPQESGALSGTDSPTTQQPTFEPLSDPKGTGEGSDDEDSWITGFHASHIYFWVIVILILACFCRNCILRQNCCRCLGDEEKLERPHTTNVPSVDFFSGGV